MRIHRPVALFPTRSILQLILLGFVAVALPLVIALITAAVYVDRLTTHSKRSVLEAVAATQSSRLLVEHLTAMERSARQFQVLNDRTLLDAYKARRKQLYQTVGELLRLDLKPLQRETIDTLVGREEAVYRQLDDPTTSAAEIAAAIESFSALNASAREILSESSQLIGESVGEIQGLAERARLLLLWQALTLIPIALLLTVLFIALIAKPLRQLDQSIRRLGDGDFGQEITVGGPNDLKELGRRLEWMRQRLLTLENQKVSFLRHVSHELKTPLTTIREGSELLKEQVVGSLNEEQSEIVNMLKQQSLKLQKLIEDLLRFSTLEIDSQRMTTEPVALDQMIREVSANHKLAARSRSVELRLKLEPVVVTGDREKLRTVVDNLLSNAVKYTPDKEYVRISLARRDGAAVIDVADTGPGIHPDERDKIFAAFYQGRARSAGAVKGSGLGLSIARELIHLHHGTIEIIDGDGGAHFRVTLPDAGGGGAHNDPR
ncbi:MAG: HAMP domain-containing histidine kinase [Gammaproteobacteria bacterium]|nr:HAMP domain-containing histidine kinase [Gammaproteobacteria bacterium]